MWNFNDRFTHRKPSADVQLGHSILVSWLHFSNGLYRHIRQTIFNALSLLSISSHLLHIKFNLHKAAVRLKALALILLYLNNTIHICTIYIYIHWCVEHYKITAHFHFVQCVIYMQIWNMNKIILTLVILHNIFNDIQVMKCCMYINMWSIIQHFC